MRGMMKRAVCVLGLLALLVGCDDWGRARLVVSLNGEGWKFTKDPSRELKAAAVDFDDSKWQTVEVPHDWAISGPFDPEAGGGSGKLPWKGVGWYRRALEMPADLMKAVEKGAALWLEFDGVMARPEVYVNGERAGGWDYGYMSFRVDVAPFVKEGVNVLAVR